MSTTTYNFVATTAPGRVEALQAPIPQPKEADQVLIKAEYTSLTPFDVYQADLGWHVNNYPLSLGTNVGGKVAKVGSGVTDLSEGDRVVAFAYVPGNKGLQEYSIHPRSVITKIPDDLPLEKATTVPDNVITGFYTLFSQLGLPFSEEFPPTEAPQNADRPILIYGGGATSGQYMVELLKLAKYTNVVAVASPKHTDYLRGLGAKAVVDYRSPSFVDDVATAFGGDGKAELVADCISLDSTFGAIAKVIRPGGSLAFLAPLKHKGVGNLTGEEGELLFEVPEELTKLFHNDVKFICVRTFLYQQDKRLTNTLAPVIIARLLRDKLITPNRIILLDKGHLLERTNDALELLRENKVSGEKVVIKITP
ncbi:GroES-like protein [Coprinopsis marcescibilis]|uniref:GroES-like protein n=1 Tax=Coprinopsis marcescibilis TaxID=230819 RepID=A0A5C3L2H8_COPMA|nr:GroES-like protein [Coprinopsis marcescibilis]